MQQHDHLAIATHHVVDAGAVHLGVAMRETGKTCDRAARSRHWRDAHAAAVQVAVSAVCNGRGALPDSVSTSPVTMS